MLTNCTHDTHTADCRHNEDASVRCSDTRKQYNIFLYDNFLVDKLDLMNLIVQASVRMETLGWWEEPISMKDVWKFAGMRSGALCVMITGQPRM